jgi:hypothetical protein
LLAASFWFTYTTPKFGNCFTFNTLENAASDDFVPRQASLTGRDNGKGVHHPTFFVGSGTT